MNKIIIIGAGITGLSAGIHALEKGYDVEIYEKNKTPGGCCTGWYRDGYYINNCMHWLTGTNQHTKEFKLWKKVGAFDERSNLYQGKYFYKSIYENEEISLYYDLERTRKEMTELSYIDKKEIDRFIDTTAYLTRSMTKNSFFKKWTLLLKGYSSLIMYYYKHTIETLSQKFKHPLLKKLITDYIPSCYSSIALIYSYATFASGNGKIYTEGSLALSQNIAKRFTELCGKLYLNSEVKRIDYNKKSIILANGENIFYDNLIYTGDPFHLFKHLLPEHLICEELLSKYTDKNNSCLTLSSFHVAFTIPESKKDTNSFFDTIVFEIPKTTVGVDSITRLVLRDYSYIANKCNCYQFFVFQTVDSYHYWKDLSQNKEEYEEKKNQIANKLLQSLINNYSEFKEAKIIDIWTPVTYNRYFNSFNGCYLSFVYNNKSKIKKIPYKIEGIDNVYMASIWQSNIGGLPVALNKGADIIKKYF